MPPLTSVRIVSSLRSPRLRRHVSAMPQLSRDVPCLPSRGGQLSFAHLQVRVRDLPVKPTR